MRSRRTLSISLFIVAALLLVVLLNSGEDGNQATRPVDTSPPEPTRTILATIPADPDEPEEVEAKNGDLIELTVLSEGSGSVSLGGYDRIEPVDATSPAKFSILADIVGEFPIELRPQGGTGEARRVGLLRVTER